ncbi:LysE family translocator [Microbaculum marinum]|uniref:LysE family transporter n=1 Tax=Microbaculum marinum TaxID=1764581 RepID=A0AAW9RPG8_9HYPH
MTNLLVIPVGILIGIVVSAPVGPVNIICIGRALRLGFVPAVLAGVGAAVGDGVLALIAAFGINAVAEAVSDHSRLIQLVGGLILIGFGIRVTMSTPQSSARADAHISDSAIRIIPATFLITITNPGALLGFLAIFGGIVGEELLPEGDYAAAVLMVLAVSGGALLWWAGISAFVARIRHLISDATLRRINIVSGVLLAGLGILLIVRATLHHLGVSIL